MSKEESNAIFLLRVAWFSLELVALITLVVSIGILAVEFLVEFHSLVGGPWQ